MQGIDLLGGNLVGNLGDSALGDLETLVDFFLDRLLFLLNGGGEGLGAAGKVAGQVGVGGEAGRVLGDEVIEGSFEVAFLEVLVAGGVLAVLNLQGDFWSASEACDGLRLLDGGCLENAWSGVDRSAAS